MAVNKNQELNDRIRDREVRLVGDDGAQLGIMPTRDAQRIADEKSLDLVKISPGSNGAPAVCKIMDYSKFIYDMQKKDREQRRNQRQVEVKEVQLSMTIDTHDLETKAKNAYKFLDAGDKVKTLIRMKGRQQAHPEFGFDVMNRFFELVKEVGLKDAKGIFQEGRNIVMFLESSKGKDKKN